MNWLQWIASTIAVLALIVIMGRGARWMLGRAAFDSAACDQLAQWRISPDASVRAVRVFDAVHLVLETRRQSSPLESMTVEEFESKTAQHPQAERNSILRLLPSARAPKSKVAVSH